MPVANTVGLVRARGVVGAITLSPLTAAPRFQATVSVSASAAAGLAAAGSAVPEQDGHGPLSVRLVWLGQRRVRGIEPGTVLSFEGRPMRAADEVTFFNPRYALEYTRSPFKSA